MFLSTFIDPITSWFGESFSNQLENITILSVVIRLLFSVLLGGVIGLERATKRHAAGLRTYILVSVGACVAMMTNQYLVKMYSTGDAARIASQVVSGIGFLGAGTILISSRNRIKGLTTAAGLWACACIGIAIGSGFYTMAIVGTVVIFLVLTFLPKFEYRVRDRGRYIEYHVEFSNADNVRKFIDLLRSEGIIVHSAEMNPGFSSDKVFSYSFIIERSKIDKRKHSEMIESYQKLDFILFIEEMY